GQQTLADLPKITGAYTQPGRTQPEGRVGPTGTRTASEEATLMERGVTQQQQTQATMAGMPTQAERKATIGSNEATVMENFARTQAGGAGGASAPTAVERKWGGESAAAPTVLERQYQPAAAPPKKNTGMIAAIAADEASTPARIQLAPGKYLVTLSGPSGKATVDVQIDAGRSTAKRVDMGGVNFDELEKEVTKQ